MLLQLTSWSTQLVASAVFPHVFSRSAEVLLYFLNHPFVITSFINSLHSPVAAALPEAPGEERLSWCTAVGGRWPDNIFHASVFYSETGGASKSRKHIMEGESKGWRMGEGEGARIGVGFGCWLSRKHLQSFIIGCTQSTLWQHLLFRSINNSDSLEAFGCVFMSVTIPRCPDSWPNHAALEDLHCPREAGI